MKKADVKLLLASSSPYRRAILEKLNIPFTYASPDINETPYQSEKAETLVRRLAEQKCVACRSLYPEHYIIGSDQAVEFEGNILGKPGNHSAATRQLESFSGKSVTFLTSVSLLLPNNDQPLTRIDTTTVHFRTLSHQDIERYLRTDTPYDCAGSFKSEGLGIALFHKIETNDPNALVGLPLIHLIDLLHEAELAPLDYIRA